MKLRMKRWMSIKEHGLERFGRMMARNVDQAHYLGQLIANEPDMELLAPISLDIVCFRFNPGGMDDTALNALNKDIHRADVSIRPGGDRPFEASRP